MKQYIAAQFSSYGIYEAVSHSIRRPPDDPCMSRTFVSGKAGRDFHVTVCWYVWEEHPELSRMEEDELVRSADAEVYVFDEDAVRIRLAEYTRSLLSYENDGYASLTSSRCVIAGEDEGSRAVLVLYREGDDAIEALTDDGLWELDVTMLDNNMGYSREEFSRFRCV